MKWNEAMEKLSETTTVTKRELVLGAAACTFLGMVIGMFSAKMATGWSWSFSLGSGNGCGNHDNQATTTTEKQAGKKLCKKQKYKNMEEKEE